jgi:hypothetical protein
MDDRVDIEACDVQCLPSNSHRPLPCPWKVRAPPNHFAAAAAVVVVVVVDVVMWFGWQSRAPCLFVYLRPIVPERMRRRAAMAQALPEIRPSSSSSSSGSPTMVVASPEAVSMYLSTDAYAAQGDESDEPDEPSAAIAIPEGEADPVLPIPSISSSGSGGDDDMQRLRRLRSDDDDDEEEDSSRRGSTRKTVLGASTLSSSSSSSSSLSSSMTTGMTTGRHTADGATRSNTTRRPHLPLPVPNMSPLLVQTIHNMPPPLQKQALFCVQRYVLVQNPMFASICCCCCLFVW